MKNFNTRGFIDFVGEEVVKVDTSAINVVHFICKSGKVISVHGENSLMGIPVISVDDSAENNIQEY
jgi:hypothetical protein